MKISESGQYLLTAKKMSLQKTSYYLLTMNENHLSRKSESFLGKIRYLFSLFLLFARSNFLGTEYLFYDNGDNPAKTTNLENVRRQLGIVYYESNFLVSRGPRRMSLVIPRLDDKGEPK
jgi:tubby-related protein 1